jgi:hypothetical protein
MPRQLVIFTVDKINVFVAFANCLSENADCMGWRFFYGMSPACVRPFITVHAVPD